MNGKGKKPIVTILKSNQHMKKIFLSIILAISTTCFAERTDSIPANPADVSTVDAIIKSVYDVISGPAGEKRNWDRMRTLFVPDARMMPTGKKPNGDGWRRALTVEEYITS